MPPRAVILATPALPCVVDASVFDAFAWHASTVLEWRSPASGFEINALDVDLVLRLAFVLRAPWSAVPTELARLHAGRGYDLADELALAPYGIDDATDQLHEHRRAATDVFWLAADNLNALYWGLHDWSHFHNHGAFEQRTATEFQCDVSALAWLWINRARIPLEMAAWDTLRIAVARAHHDRSLREPPATAIDAMLLTDRDALIRFADALASHDARR